MSKKLCLSAVVALLFCLAPTNVAHAGDVTLCEAVRKIEAVGHLITSLKIAAVEADAAAEHAGAVLTGAVREAVAPTRGVPQAPTARACCRSHAPVVRSCCRSYAPVVHAPVVHVPMVHTCCSRHTSVVRVPVVLHTHKRVVRHVPSFYRHGWVW